MCKAFYVLLYITVRINVIADLYIAGVAPPSLITMTRYLIVYGGVSHLTLGSPGGVETHADMVSIVNIL